MRGLFAFGWLKANGQNALYYETVANGPIYYPQLLSASGLFYNT